MRWWPSCNIFLVYLKVIYYKEWTLPRSSQSSRRRRFLAREMSENSTHRRTGGEDHRRYKLTRRCNFLDDLRIGSGQSRSEDTDIAAKKEAHPSPTRYQHIPTGLPLAPAWPPPPPGVHPSRDTRTLRWSVFMTKEKRHRRHEIFKLHLCKWLRTAYDSVRTTVDRWWLLRHLFILKHILFT